jgi:hypothetical protein
MMISKIVWLLLQAKEEIYLIIFQSIKINKMNNFKIIRIIIVQRTKII